ncbi:MAG: carboxypeptidase regulatory-like domain-containing protein, partial [Pirellulaceae bacterium]|nr:carboxypeptidase regulatory-like domain-containing protein [Pirellulaceae bacterium]
MMRYLSSALALCVALSLAGCSGMSDAPKLAKAKGVVKLNGNPLANIGVTFFPTSGPPAFGNTNAQGEFVLMTIAPRDGAAVGSHRVALGKAEEGSSEKGAAAAIAEKYAFPDKSGLTAEVESGK